MNHIKRKLRSNAGASMLLAMIFMAFCVFVGGSVLAAATANGGRVARQAKDQQAYLSQRSAALVVADQLKGHEDDLLQMTVVQKKTETIVQKPDTADSKTEQVNITFSLPKVEYVGNDGSTNIVPKNSFQELLYHGAAVYAEQAICGEGITIDKKEYENFDFVYSNNMAHTTSGTMTVKDPTDAELNMIYSMSPDYDFLLTFGEESQLRLIMNAYVGTSEPVTVTQESKDGAVTTITTTTTTTTVIRWDDPIIEKGGA